MKSLIFPIVIAFTILACGPNKSETTITTDSTAVDSTVLADKPAPSALAFSPVPGLVVSSKVAQSDSLEFMLLGSQGELDEKFTAEKGTETLKPDFIINYVVGITGLPTKNATTIILEKVETGDSDINLYLNFEKGNSQLLTSRPSAVFAIEKRDGFVALQFFVNGKKDKALILPMN